MSEPMCTVARVENLSAKFALINFFFGEEEIGDMAENVDDKVEEESVKLTDAQKARIERNRQRALLLKQTSLANHSHRSLRSNNIKKTIDTGGGFIIEEEDIPKTPMKIVEKPIPVMLPNEEDRLHCDECSQEFLESYLFTNFNCSVCNSCRDNDGKHKLITKTEARTQFLLKDCDFDSREPPLKFIVKRNPHHQHGEMKLYLYDQIYKRAMVVWESEDQLDAEHERREAEQKKRKDKKYAKKMKDLRMNVRSSLYKRNLEGHQHEYGNEEYNSDDDEYTKTCSTCGHKLTYEKM